MADPITRGIDEYWLVMGGFEPDTTDAIAAACRAAIAADRALNAAPAQPAERASSHAIALALIRPECDRLREWASIGPVQRAAVESFADAIVAGAGAERAPSVGAEGRHLTITTNTQGDAVLVSWQDDEHRILEVVWERA